MGDDIAAADPVEAKVLPAALDVCEKAYGLLDVAGVGLEVDTSDVACQGAVVAGKPALDCAHGAAVVAIGFAQGALVPAFEASCSSSVFLPELGNSSIVPLFLHGNNSPNQKCCTTGCFSNTSA